jgi:membrane dipeptidase
VIVVDGLLVSNWGPAVFAAMRSGGITAANCTCCVWEGFRETVGNIMRLQALIREHDDLVCQVRDVEDIRQADRDGRSGVILGFQNLSAIEGDLGHLGVFHQLGVRVAQLTYNTQNLVGSGCYESSDGGLSDFGREVIAEMNRLGILIDLSHVGPDTARDAVAASSVPVAYTHVAPAALARHPRNKTDEELRRVAEAGGVVGITFLTWFLEGGSDSTLEHCVRALEHAIDVAGEDHVAFGTDFTEGHGPEFLEWIMRDKGTARLLVDDVKPLAMPQGLGQIRDLPNLIDAMSARGWSDDRITKVMGANWLRLYAETWAWPQPSLAA